MYQFDLNVIIQALPEIWNGIKLTLFISVISSFFAFIIGAGVAFIRTADYPFLKKIASFYVEIFRNTPLLIQLYMFYKGLPNIGLDLGPVLCGILSLSLYTGAFISEVLRSGLNSIAHEQYEAARALGLSKTQTFKMIVFPQAIRIVIPPLGSQFINLIKNSSLVSFIAVSDLFYVIYKGAVDDFRFIEFFAIGALFYMIITGFVAIVTNILEYKLKIPGRSIRV